MDDLISRAAAIKAVLSEERYCERNMDDETTAAVRMARFKLEKVPVVDVVPVVHGRWMERHVDYASDCAIEEVQTLRCSVCQLYLTTPYLYNFTNYKFCPNCGAKMDGDA